MFTNTLRVLPSQAQLIFSIGGKQTSDITITSKDEEFLQKEIRMVEAHITDDQFTVEVFQKQIGMSRMQLHRKLKALTDLCWRIYPADQNEAGSPTAAAKRSNRFGSSF